MPELKGTKTEQNLMTAFAGNQETAAAAQEVNTMSGEIEEAAKGIAEHAYP